MAKKQNTMPTTKHYVLGFYFSPNYERIVLIKKTHPDWQVGLLNGVGGHIEYNETPERAMIREFEEEAGVNHTDWIDCGKFRNVGEVVTIFKTTGSIEHIRTSTDEKIYIRGTIDVLDDLTTNLELRLSNKQGNVRPILPHLSFLLPLILANVKFDITGTEDLRESKAWILSTREPIDMKNKLYGTPNKVQIEEPISVQLPLSEE